jgi:two-component system cell cycle response regulator DivK
MSKKKILLAEDSFVIQNITRKVLELNNCEVSFAKDGKQTLEKYAKEHFDLIILDINMPGMDGIQCAKAIRNLSNPQKAAIPLLAITGNAKNYTENDFKQFGFNAFLIKPLNFDILIQTVKQYTN